MPQTVYALGSIRPEADYQIQVQGAHEIRSISFGSRI